MLLKDTSLFVNNPATVNDFDNHIDTIKDVPLLDIANKNQMDYQRRYSMF